MLSSALLVGTASLAAAQPIAATEPATPPNLAAEKPFLTENNAAMRKMMAMVTIRPTGDADRDFVAMMAPHHQGAIDMAQAELRYGHNEQLLRIAQEIVVEQLQEIAAMHIAVGDVVSPDAATLAASMPGIAGTPAPASPPHTATTAVSLKAERPFLKDNDTAMTRMMNDMTVKPTGNVDSDFVAMMVPHHQGAIDMAQTELRDGHNARLRRIAQEIIVDQMQEIALMRLAVGEALPSPLAAPTNPAPTAAPQSQTGPQQPPQMPMQMAPGQTNMQ